MAAVVATEQTAEPSSASPSCAVPDGTAHAVEVGTRVTRCGLDVAELVVWPELSWPPMGLAALDTCAACEG